MPHSVLEAEQQSLRRMVLCTLLLQYILTQEILCKLYSTTICLAM